MADEDETEDDKKFTERFNKLFHKASKERETRQMKSIDKLLSDKLGDFVKTLGKKPKGEDDEEADPDDEENTAVETPPAKTKKRETPAPQTASLSAEDKARLAKAERDAKEAKTRADKFETEAKKEREERRRSEELAELTSGLSGMVKPALMKMVVADLHGKIVRDESGKMLWKEDEDTILPFKDGLEAWKKSDAAKEVAPPREAGGRGGRGPGDGTTPANNGPLTLEGLGSIVMGSIPK